MYHFTPSPLDPRLEVADARLPPERLEEDALRMNRASPDAFVFCGMHDDHDREHRMYRARDVHPAELAALFRVGSHGGEEEEDVRAQLEEVHRAAPFFPTWVDAAGFRGPFRDPVSRETALRVAGALRVGLEGYLQDDDSGVGFGSSLEEDLAAVVFREQGLHLWWD